MRVRQALYPSLLLLLCLLAVAAGPLGAAEIGSLSGTAGHGLAFIGERDATFYAQVVAMWGGYNDTRPHQLDRSLEDVIKPIPVGGFFHDVWNVGAVLGDNFSARWTGVLKVPADAEYTLYLTSDDGARMWVGDKQVVNEWKDRSPTTTEAKISLKAGDYPVRVEYFEHGGGAMCRLEVSAEGLARQVLPTSVISSDGKPGWKAEYFKSPDLKGEAFPGRADTIDFDWGNGGPPEFGGEDPIVHLDCGRLSERVAVLRVKAPSPSRIGAVVRGQLPEMTRFVQSGDEIIGSILRDGTLDWGGFRLRAIGRRPAGDVHEEGSYAGLWLSAEQPVYLVAGQGLFPDLTIEQAEDAIAKCLASGQNAPFPYDRADADGWVSLFDGRDLDGWLPRHSDQPNRWRVEDGVLINDGAGTDLYSDVRLSDFMLHIEFNVAKGGNSGVYLQGRYEVQIADWFGKDLFAGMCGSIYHKATPTRNVCKPAGEWQSFDVTFKQARLAPDGSVAENARATVIQNGVKIIDDAEIDGPTGSAMDGRVWEAHGIMLQGDHGPIKYRNIKVRALD